MELHTVSCFLTSNSQHGKWRNMTETKTPVRRTARTQPAKAPSTAARAPAAGLTGAKAATKTATPKVTSAPKKPAAKAPAKPAAKAPGTAAVKAPAVAKSQPVAPTPSPAAAPQTPVAQVKTRVQPKGDSFKLRMLVDQVVKATGAKKKGVKDMVEATLSGIGQALARGDELNLPGFGKVRVVKSDAKDGTAIMTLKLRQGSSTSGQKGLAASGDDD